MIQLRLLGSIALTGPAGEELPAVLRQPKRLALLAYLAVASPRGYHRRDTLLALFWPERDAEHARAALSHGLYTLRRALGEGVIISRGDDEVGLAAELCWCDAVAFEDAAAAGRLEEASGLYRGDLLAGFHLPDAPEFERWLEDVRTRFRDRAAQAAWMLAGEDEANARLPSAVRWARRGVALSPYHETGIRRLMVLLDGAGDRAEAVREYEQFARRLSVDLELEPSAETVALVEAIRKRQGPGSSRNGAAADGLDRRETPPQDPTPVPPSPAPRAPEARRRRWMVPATIGLLALGAIGVLRTVARSAGSPPTVPTQPTAIAILPFAYRGNPELSYLGEGMADLLSTRVDGAAGLRSIDQRTLLTYLNRQGGIADSQRGRLAAERFGAGFFVLGSMVEAGGRLQVSATIYDARAKPRRSVETVAASETEIFDAADRLARHVLAGIQDRPLALAGVADQTTSSLPALKAYLEGEREVRAGRSAQAQDAFRRATELDTTFALAYYRLSYVTTDPALAIKALDHALRHSDRLAKHHHWLLEAVAALLRGDHTLADQRARQVVTIRPDDAEGWFMFAMVTLGKAHLLGRAWVDAREAFERALALGPENAEAVWWLAAIAATDRRLSDLDSLTDRLLQLDPAPWLAGNARGQRAIMMGDTAGEARFVAELRERPDPWAQSSAGVVTWTTGDLAAGRRLWRLITEPHRSRGFRVMAHVTLAKIELTNGRWNAASDELEALVALDPAAALEHRAFYALTRFLGTTRSELRALRDSLQRWDPASARAEGDGLIAIHRTAHPYFRLYLLGLLSARLGEPSVALGYAAELERTDSSSPLGVFARDQGQFVRAEVAWMGGRRQEALTLLDQARYWTTDSGRHENGDSPFFIQLHERFARAELLYELGRHGDALPWYRSLSYDFLYTAPAHLRLAQIYEHRGERRNAIDHYSRFLGLWRSSDPALQPLVQQARHALARLR